MLIKTAGYMWNREYVDWSKRRLMGSPEEGDGAEANFADQSAIYGLYSANHECVYIGQAGSGDSSGLFERLKAHAIEDHLFCFWQRFMWFGFYSAEQLKAEKYPDPVAKSLSLGDALNTIESIAIYLAMPRHNLRKETGFSDVEWYFQPAEHERLKTPKKAKN